MSTYTGYNLITATKAFFTNYTNFKGRSTASAYWMWIVMNAIISIPITLIDAQLDGTTVASIYSLATIIPSWALGFRRLHDVGKSGWNILWVLLPLIGWIYLIVLACKDSQKGTNAWGSSEKYPDTEENPQADEA